MGRIPEVVVSNWRKRGREDVCLFVMQCDDFTATGVVRGGCELAPVDPEHAANEGPDRRRECRQLGLCVVRAGCGIEYGGIINQGGVNHSGGFAVNKHRRVGAWGVIFVFCWSTLTFVWGVLTLQLNDHDDANSSARATEVFFQFPRHVRQRHVV